MIIIFVKFYIFLARYFARYPQQYYPVYSPQDDFNRPNQIANNFDQANQQEDESEVDFFRSR